MGLPAVVEVRLPAELAATIPPEPDAEYVGAKDRRTIAQWVQAGVKQGNGAALKLSSGEGEQAYLFAPTGSRGPVFRRPSISTPSCTTTSRAATRWPWRCCSTACRTARAGHAVADR